MIHIFHNCKTTTNIEKVVVFFVIYNSMTKQELERLYENIGYIKYMMYKLYNCDDEDILHEAIIKLYNSNTYNSNISGYISYLLVIIKNMILQQKQKKKVDLVYVGDWYDGVLSDIEDIDESEPLLSPEGEKRLYGFINALEPNFRSVIVLFYFEKKSIKEIAEIEGVNINTIKSRMKRAKELLFKAYKYHSF